MTTKHTNKTRTERTHQPINDFLADCTASRFLRLNPSYTWIRYTDGIDALQELSRDWVFVQEVCKLIESTWLVSASLWDRRLATHQQWLFERGDPDKARLVVRSVTGGEELFARPIDQLQNYPFGSAEIWADWHMNIHDEPGWTIYLPSEHHDIVSGPTSRTIREVLWSRMEDDRDPWE